MDSSWRLLPGGPEGSPEALLNWLMVVCMGMTMFDAGGWYLTWPVMTPYSVSLGMTVMQATQVFTARAALVWLSGPLLSRFGDLYGMKKSMVLSGVGASVGYMMQLGSFAANAALGSVAAMWTLNTGRLVTALFVNVGAVTNSAVALGTPDNSELMKTRNNVLGALRGISLPLFNVLGGALSKLGLIVPFVVVVGGAVSVAGLTVTMPKVHSRSSDGDAREGQTEEGEKDETSPVWRILTDPLLNLAALFCMGLGGVADAIMVLFPIVLSFRSPKDSLTDEAGERSNAFIVGCSGLVTGVSLGLGVVVNKLILARCVRISTMMIGGAMLQVLAIVGMALATGPRSYLCTFVPFGVGTGQMLADMYGTAMMVVTHRHPAAVAQAGALVASGKPLGSLLCPIVAVHLLGPDGQGEVGAFLFVGLLTAMSGAIIWGIQRHVDDVIEPEVKRLEKLAREREGAAA